MDIEDAYRLLEIDRSVDATMLKRAYLRKVKQTSPERDPRAFQRVREAYEMARSYVSEASPWGASSLPPIAAQTQAATDASIQVAASDRFATVLEGIERGDLAALAAELGELLDELEARPGIGVSSGATLDPLWLRYLVKQRREQAQDLLRRWDAYCRAHNPRELESALDPGLLVRSVAVRELYAAPTGISPATLEALARGVLYANLPKAERTLARLVDEKPLEASTLAEYLRTSAPTLHQLYGAAFPDSEGDRAEVPWTWRGEVWSRIVFVVVTIALMLVQCYCTNLSRGG